MEINGRLIMSLIMLGIFVTMVAMAVAYPADSRFLPFVIGLPAIALAGSQVIFEIIAARRRRPDPSPRADTSRVIREGIIFGWFLTFVAAILLLGFLVAAPLAVFAFLRLQQGESWRLSLTLAGGAWLLLYLMFEKLLRLGLFGGFIFTWIGG